MTRPHAPFSCLIVCLLACLLAAPAIAQTGKDDKKRKSQTMSKPVATKLIAAQELLQNEQLGEAKKALDAVVERRGLSPLERANIFNLYGYLASEQGNQKKAIAYFLKAIKEDALPLAQQYSLEYNVAQLFMMEGDFERALKILRGWFKKTSAADSPVTPNGGNYYILALCHMNLEPPDVSGARKPAERAVAASDSPQENWLRLLGQIYYMQKDWMALAETLETLIERFNKADYYTQLAGAYAEAGKERKSLAVLQLAYTQGLLVRDGQIRHLARAYLYHKLPYRAALVLQKGLDDEILEPDLENLQLLADAWLAAREPQHAYDPLEKAAALADDGDLYVRLAQAYVQEQRWKEADEALGRALEHRELDDRGTAHLLRGLARMNREMWNEATASFDAAAKFDDREESALQYKRYLQSRRRQLEALRS